MELLSGFKKILPPSVKRELKRAARRFQPVPENPASPTAGGQTFSPNQQPLDSNDPISRRFTELGPWFTEFRFNGRSYGGTNRYAGDCRISDFLEWLDTEGSLLELASFEAGHSTMLLQDSRIKSILGLDGRHFLIDRANYIKELFKYPQLKFELCDFEADETELKKYGKFNVAFCSGLLYHLYHPKKFVEQVATVSDRFFLSTHYTLKEGDENEGYKGEFKPEFGYNEPCSGLKAQAFWLSFPSLVRLLTECGFKIAHVRDHSDAINGPVANIYCTK